MLGVLGYDSLDELIDATIPAGIRTERPLAIREDGGQPGGNLRLEENGLAVRERLEREFDLSLIATAPSVGYEVELENGACRGTCRTKLRLNVLGTVNVLEESEEGWLSHRFTSHFACNKCGHEFIEPTPHMFSFNSPLGACESCRGFGRVIGVDFGTNSVRAVVVDAANGSVAGTHVFDYPSGDQGVILDPKQPLPRHDQFPVVHPCLDRAAPGPRVAVPRQARRRETVAQLATALDCDQLRWWASPDVLWDDIVAIEPAGWTQVIDFTVPELHNFVELWRGPRADI